MKKMLKKNMLKKVGLLIIILVAIYLMKGSFQNFTGMSVFGANTSKFIDEATRTQISSADVVFEEILLPDVYFCPSYNCSAAVVDLIRNANESVHCALFDLDLIEMIEAFDDAASRGVDVKIVVDKDNYEMIEKVYGKVLGEGAEGEEIVKFDNDNQLMHNKFCIFDNNTATTGSFNPTINCNTKNNNNLVVVKSRYLAENYEDEFSELWAGYFGKGEKELQTKVKYDRIESSLFSGKNEKNVPEGEASEEDAAEDDVSEEDKLLFENYFCPEDNCEKHVLDVLSSANESIKFMIYSFTSDAIGDKIVEKFKGGNGIEGIEVKGIVEKKQNTADYSEYWTLTNAGIDVAYDTNPYNLHHKVFIVDDEIVITGSYNPTASGTNKNDENVLIIYNKEIAGRYVEEFEELISLSS